MKKQDKDKDTRTTAVSGMLKTQSNTQRDQLKRLKPDSGSKKPK